MSRKNLSELKKADIGSCDAESLTDLNCIKINSRESKVRKTASFISEVGNPYLFKVNSTIVKVDFVGDRRFDELLFDVLIAG